MTDRSAAGLVHSRNVGAARRSDRFPMTRGRVPTATALTAPALLAIFMATVPLPVSFDLVGLRLTPLRIVLLLTFIPLVIRLLAGKAGRIVLADVFLLLFCFWMALTLVLNDGMGRIAFSGISTVELLGGYLIGRCLVRSAADFKLLFRLHLYCLAFLFPFALVELFSGRIFLSELLDPLGSVPYKGPSSRPRMGLERVMTGFDHPILFGLFCSLGAANVFYIWRDRIGSAFARLAFVTGMTFMSLSSGALLSVMIQAQLITWDAVTKGRWKLLLILTAIVYVFLEFASNRGPILIFIETFTFNPGNAWTRIHQWNYGTAEVFRHPLFGMGLTGDWVRPRWLVDSIDNFWLVIAMRHGLPGIAFLLLAFVALGWRVLRARNLPPDVARYRTGYMIGLIGLFFTLSTVHIWGAVSVVTMLYLGAGAWLGDQSGAGPSEEGTSQPIRGVGRGRPGVPSADRHRGGADEAASAEPRIRPRRRAIRPARDKDAETRR